ncbi:MAG: tetratricopeptide repeat protein [Acidobacteriota bacterium]
MKRHFVFRYCFLVVLFLLLFLVFIEPVFSGELTLKEKAGKALREGDYSRAVLLCREGLKESPDDYELNFILARAYAFSGERRKARKVGEVLVQRFPENTDVLLFMARLDAWDKNYEEAREGYEFVLKIQPGNKEARIGLAELAAWEGHYQEAVNIYTEILESEPRSHEVIYRLGQVYLWQGNRRRAGEYFRRALSLEPGNSRYREAVNAAMSYVRREAGFYYEFNVERFSDKRGSYRDDRLVLELPLPEKRGNILFKIGQTERFSKRDYQYGFEAYPLFSKSTYGYFEFFYSSRAVHFPRTRYHLEIYQGVRGRGEFSLGFRRYNFDKRGISFYLGSAGIYMGNYYAFLRCLISSGGDEGVGWNGDGDGEEIEKVSGSEFSWLIQGRRYFSEVNYIYIGYGQGGRPVEIITLEDFLAGKSSIFLAGGDWTLWRSIRVRAQWLFRKDEGGLKRNALFLSLGYLF